MGEKRCFEFLSFSAKHECSSIEIHLAGMNKAPCLYNDEEK